MMRYGSERKRTYCAEHIRHALLAHIRFPLLDRMGYLSLTFNLVGSARKE